MRKTVIAIVSALLVASIVLSYYYFSVTINFGSQPVAWSTETVKLPKADLEDYPLGITLTVTDKNAAHVTIKMKIIFKGVKFSPDATVSIQYHDANDRYIWESPTASIINNTATIEFTVSGPKETSSPIYRLHITLHGTQEIDDNASITIQVIKYIVES
ncbi:MAG: hypothetical protein GXO43_09920 [Crenarchaeota archaeon]|nr:hypothetical protein [Thermoproteota archaeon]